ncbi:MAG: tRNA (N(6)-L-threonylcarbamoyladenosine(37)-C(2))-methylthiotransferase MtaB [Candidatus Rokubacteria bacterium]|nr:tRNA (N(6)-L-threonylcarbamoyladenosine(37)-C(2))-methylthiotransferase MtaB [Candidatus Rokubacteria bacterium]
MTRTVSFATLGCRLNQVDTQELQALLEARGFRTVPFEEPADVVVVNSCTVTSRADVSSRQMLRRGARRNPGARVVVTGCWAQTDPAAAAATGADLVVGNAEKRFLPELVERLLARGASPGRDGTAPVHVGDIARARAMDPPPPPARVDGRSRAFLKIQEGCQHRCAFCIVPLARGPSRSRGPEVLLDQVRVLVEAGHAEVVLTGVDLGHYGADLAPRTTLAALLRRMVEIPRLRWIRLSSILPAYVTEELFELLAGSPVMAPHLHLPLQSGSDRVLRRMRRPYTVAMYRRLAERLAGAIPSLGLGADVIAGFPGETDADLAGTVALVEALPLSYLHVFAYSDRRGTEAARLGDRVDARTIARRSRWLREVGREKNRAFRAALVGSTREVLVLETRDGASGGLVGLTGNYVEVVFRGPGSLVQGMTRVRVTAADAARTLGQLERGGVA